MRRISHRLSQIVIYSLSLATSIIEVLILLLHLHLDLLMYLLLHPHVCHHLLVLQVLVLTHLGSYEITHLVYNLRSSIRIT